MRVRALAVAMLLFGLAGALASFGPWWFQFRYGQSFGDAAGVHLACTQHCGGVDGPYLAGLIASGAVAVFGLVIALTTLARGRT